LLAVTDDFISDNEVKNSIILIDNLKTDLFNVFRVTESIDYLELFYLYPDKYFHDSTTIVYFFDNSTSLFDTIFLENINKITAKVINQEKIDLIWSKDSLLPSYLIYRFNI
jgi:hypothetical protein